MNNPKKQNNISRYIKLEDYKIFDYEIPEIFLDFVIKKKAVNVTTKLKLVKKNKNSKNLIPVSYTHLTLPTKRIV